MTKKTVKITAVGEDKASKVLSGVGASVSKLGSIAGTVATGGVALAAGAIVGLGAVSVGAAIGVGKLTMAAADVENTRKVFYRLEGDMDSLREATRRMVGQTDLMGASNALLTMGVAKTTDEVAEMAEMATQLGLAMHKDATKSMEEFTLLLTNQSIERLDSFGISSVVVRARIAELQEATEGLSREEAFKIATMEQGRIAMEKVGEQGDSATATTLRWKAALEDTGYGIGKAFVPALEAIRGPALGLVEEYGPRVVEWAEKAGEWLGEKVPVAMDWLKGAWEDIQPGLIWGRDMFKAFAEEYIPILVSAWGNLQEGWDEIATIYRIQLKPALDELWETLGFGEASSEDIGKAIGKVVGVLTILATSKLVEGISTGIETFSGIVRTTTAGIDALRHMLYVGASAFYHIRGDVEQVIGRFRELRDSIAGFELPWWLTPGSPTPLETGLFGIGRALADVQRVGERGLGFGTPLGSQASSRTNNFTMNVYTQATSSTVIGGFETMKALYA